MPHAADVIVPGLDIHSVYTYPESIHDYLRIAFSRLYLSTHCLRVETGRWTRTPREFRVCLCDNVSLQDENHVMFNCHKTLEIREHFNAVVYCWKDLFDGDNRTIYTLINTLLRCFE